MSAEGQALLLMIPFELSNSDAQAFGGIVGRSLSLMHLQRWLQLQLQRQLQLHSHQICCQWGEEVKRVSSPNFRTIVPAFRRTFGCSLGLCAARQQHVAHALWPPGFVNIWSRVRTEACFRSCGAIHVSSIYICTYRYLFNTFYTHIYIASNSFFSPAKANSFCLVFRSSLFERSSHRGSRSPSTAAHTTKKSSAFLYMLYICISIYVYKLPPACVWINVWFIAARAIALDCVPNTKIRTKTNPTKGI